MRDAVRSRLHDGARHGWTIEDLQQDLHSAAIPADYSSVYRSVVWLEEQGLAERFELGDGKSRYEAPSSHHEHLRCDGCGRVTVVPDCVVQDATGQIERSTGFRLTTHRLVLTGLCPPCQTSWA